MKQRAILSAAIFLAAAGALGACSSSGSAAATEAGARPARNIPDEGGGFNPFGWGRDRSSQDPAQAQIGVNSFLWRASLDTLAFMPLASEDPYGGVIITDWYSDPSQPGERFKATVYILDTRLRADALNVSVFRQQQANGAWVDAPVNADTGIQIENAILQRARQLRLSTLNSR